MRTKSMAQYVTCPNCGANLDPGERCDCADKIKAPPRRMATPFERTRAAVYATGNRWAIENFNATH